MWLLKALKGHFLKVIDCQGDQKDAQFLADNLIEENGSMGAENVVNVIMGNAKV